MQWERLPTMLLGPPLASKKNLNDGSTQAHKRRFLARLRRQIPVVVEAFRQTPHRDKRNFDHPVATRNADVKVGDYVYTTKNNRQPKLKSKATGPFVVLDADATTFDMNIVEEEMRVSSAHVTEARRPTTTNTVPHVLKDGIKEPKHPPATADGYVNDKLLGLRQTGGTLIAKVRWFDYGSKVDTLEPLENLLRNMLVRFLRRKKKRVPGYYWKIATRKSRQQVGLTSVTHIGIKST